MLAYQWNPPTSYHWIARLAVCSDARWGVPPVALFFQVRRSASHCNLQVPGKYLSAGSAHREYRATHLPLKSFPNNFSASPGPPLFWLATHPTTCTSTTPHPYESSLRPDLLDATPALSALPLSTYERQFAIARCGHQRLPVDNSSLNGPVANSDVIAYHVDVDGRHRSCGRSSAPCR